MTAIAAIMVLSACGGNAGEGGGGEYGNSGTAQAQGTPVSAPPDALKVTLVDFKISPDPITAKAGEASFSVTNDGGTPHNLTIFDSGMKALARTPNIAPGKSAILTVRLAAGTYHVSCSMPGHESLGMSGTITVV